MLRRPLSSRRLDALQHTKSDARVNVLFPIETMSRELDFRLFLAAMCADPSRRIFVGVHFSLHDLVATELMHTGLYVGKEVFNPRHLDDTTQYDMFREHGFKLVYLDEEGAVYPGQEDTWRTYLDTRVDPNVMNADDILCAWGEFQREHYASHSDPPGVRVEATGHPRFDLFKEPFRAFFAPDAQALRREYGDYVLFNTNLSRANNHMGVEYIFSSKRGIDPEDWPSTIHNVEIWGYQTRIMSMLVETIMRVAHAFPDWKIIVRPHPSERHDTYREIFAKVENVVVKHEGPVSPWIMGSRAMIHDGCTTGLEGHLLDANVIHFHAEANEHFDRVLPNAFGARCETSGQVVDTLLALRETGELPNRRTASARVESLLTNFNEDSFQKLISLIDDAQASLTSTPVSPSPRDIQLFEDRRKVVGEAKNLVRPLFPERVKNHNYFKQKFPGFDREDLNSRFARIQEILGKKIDWHLYSDVLLVVE